MTQDPLAIMVAPNGARKTTEDHPAVPVTSAQMVRCAAECLEAGAAAIHVHVRDEKQQHVLDAELYKDSFAAIRNEIGDKLVLQMTTEAVGIYPPETQIAVTKVVKPEAVSLALREIVPDEASEKEAADFLHWIARERIWPQYIVYSGEDFQRFHDLKERGVIPADHNSVLFVLGRYVQGETDPRMLLDFLALPLDGLNWSVCAFGAPETASLVTAAGLGGHVRVGFENNLLHADGAIAASNAERVERIARLTLGIGRDVADANWLRSQIPEMSGA